MQGEYTVQVEGRSLSALITLRYAHYDWYYSLDSLVTRYYWCVYPRLVYPHSPCRCDYPFHYQAR